MEEILEAVDLEFPTKSEISSLARKRNGLIKGKNKLKKLAKTASIDSGVLPLDRNREWCLEKPVFYQKVWRGQRSKYIKKRCNRRFRQNNKFNTIVSSNKGINRKATEFWWDYC